MSLENPTGPELEMLLQMKNQTSHLVTLVNHFPERFSKIDIRMDRIEEQLRGLNGKAGRAEITAVANGKMIDKIERKVENDLVHQIEFSPYRRTFWIVMSSVIVCLVGSILALILRS